MSMKGIHEVFPNGWDDASKAVRHMHELLYGVVPEIPAVDFSQLAVPGNVVEVIRAKNRPAVRDEISVQEYTAPESPFRTQAFFDDQLVEVLFAIHRRYSPSSFVSQLVWLVSVFLNESAALRASVVQDRIRGDEARRCVDTVLASIRRADDPDQRATLELLLMELTDGGTERWVNDLNSELRLAIDEIASRD